jgi:hypothetical protein
MQPPVHFASGMAKVRGIELDGKVLFDMTSDTFFKFIHENA